MGEEQGIYSLLQKTFFARSVHCAKRA